jgi:hypothetical protein
MNETYEELEIEDVTDFAFDDSEETTLRRAPDPRLLEQLRSQRAYDEL